MQIPATEDELPAHGHAAHSCCRESEITAEPEMLLVGSPCSSSFTETAALDLVFGAALGQTHLSVGLWRQKEWSEGEGTSAIGASIRRLETTHVGARPAYPSPDSSQDLTPRRCN